MSVWIDCSCTKREKRRGLLPLIFHGAGIYGERYSMKE
jgi:hypothetical protein